MSTVRRVFFPETFSDLIEFIYISCHQRIFGVLPNQEWLSLKTVISNSFVLKSLSLERISLLLQ